MAIQENSVNELKESDMGPLRVAMMVESLQVSFPRWEDES